MSVVSLIGYRTEIEKIIDKILQKADIKILRKEKGIDYILYRIQGEKEKTEKIREILDMFFVGVEKQRDILIYRSGASLLIIFLVDYP